MKMQCFVTTINANMNTNANIIDHTMESMEISELYNIIFNRNV